MTDKAPGKVAVTFAKGVLDDVAELTATTAESDRADKEEAEALKRRSPSYWSNAKATPSPAS
ncbi:MAG: hypothetical protein ABW196_04775 [Solirubrobacterales bacterium]